MEPRISFVTLGVDDIDAARRFYVDGLGWNPTFEVPGDVLFIQVAAGVLLALWGRESLAHDVGETLGTGRAPISIAHNVGSDDAVVAIVDQARAAGATVLKEPAMSFFGGFQGYFADPSGFVWEIAHNPGMSVDADGTVHIGPP
jgi:catechol 2,3-dioxygenase-like lactoylglutathione lyase family enzyme